MNVRIFLTASSVVLVGWMTASYFSAVPLDGYASEESQPSELVYTSADQTFAEVK
jgi:hypothetical protein